MMGSAWARPATGDRRCPPHDWELENADGPVFRPLSAVAHSLTDEGDNILLVKVNRWFGL